MVLLLAELISASSLPLRMKHSICELVCRSGYHTCTGVAELDSAVAAGKLHNHVHFAQGTLLCLPDTAGVAFL